MSNTFWSKLNKYDKRKLIYVCIISPLVIIGSVSSEFTSNVYRQNGQIIFPPCGAMFGLVMTSYLPMTLPATMIRFGYFKRALNYGLEMFISMWASIIISLMLLSIMIGIPATTQGFLGTLAVYCILSYNSTGYNNITKSKRYALILLTIAVPFLAFKTIGVYPKQGFALFWEAVFITIMLNCHLPKTSDTLNSSSWQSTYTNTQHSTKSQKTPPPHTEQREAPPAPRQAEAVRLVNLGLAAIGRKTQRNLFITPEREAARRNAERTFMRQLAKKYTDTDARKVLAKHFMLFKECCLFIIFSTVLKQEPELHSLVKSELKSRITEGLTLDVKVQREKYMYAFSKAFYEEYQRTHNMERTLSFTFWNVLANKQPQLVLAEMPTLLNINGLGTVYRYVYEEVKSGLEKTH